MGAGGDSAGFGGAGVLAVGGICAAVARMGGRWVTFLYENVDVGVASRMVITMTGINRTGESNAFLRMFSCAGNGCGGGAWARVRWLALLRARRR